MEYEERADDRFGLNLMYYTELQTVYLCARRKLMTSVITGLPPECWTADDFSGVEQRWLSSYKDKSQ